MKSFTQVEFTKTGWREFSRMNRFLGMRYVTAYIMLREVEAYIGAHESQGVRLDTICQELHYGDGVYMLIMRCKGIWYITEIWVADKPAGFAPIYVWQRIKYGWQEWLAKVLVGWRITACESSISEEVAV